ncbi:ATP-dependent DNA helicase RecQ, partial [Vibrio cyclitrophicus]|nr:ATP-dependent DNA helicase RecQ [Vibrio cyclitrophicus]NOH46442.1 ATP-dependent DNA helicase RecQ [Vibrio cyclitrophicus]
GCQTSAKLMLMGFGLPLYIRPTYRRFAYVVALMTLRDCGALFVR